MNKKFRIVIFASGSGSNAEEIFKHFQHHSQIDVVALFSNNPSAYALERAKKYSIPTRVFNKVQFKESTVVLDWLQEFDATHIVLAGFLWLIPTYLIQHFPNRIINIHPALLPKYGGKGMYGMNVHEAVKHAGEVETGITIHLVNEKYDDGKVIFQGTCNIDQACTPDDIALRVHALEHKHYPIEIEKWILSETKVH